MKTKIENQIKTIKYCHTPRTRQEMDSFCEKNGITARTLRNYSKNGMDFNDVHYDMFMRYISNDSNVHKVFSRSRKKEDGSNVELVENRGELNEFFSSIHPLFLALNLTEVNLLTKRLIDLASGTDMEEAYRHLIGKIVYQLSDYAMERLAIEGSDLPAIVPAFEDDTVYRDDPQLRSAYYYKLLHVEKSNNHNDNDKV